MMKQTVGLELLAVTILCRETFFVFSMFIAHLDIKRVLQISFYHLLQE